MKIYLIQSNEKELAWLDAGRAWSLSTWRVLDPHSTVAPGTSQETLGFWGSEWMPLSQDGVHTPGSSCPLPLVILPLSSPRPYWVRTILNAGCSPDAAWLMSLFSSYNLYRIILPASLNVFYPSRSFKIALNSLCWTKPRASTLRELTMSAAFFFCPVQP